MPEQASSPPTRWNGRPILAGLVRLTTIAVPMAAGVASAVILSVSLPSPTSAAGALVWWILVFGGATGVLWLVERLARRLLPLATLLSLTMAFPDRAPSRFKVALRSGSSVGALRRLSSENDSDAAAGILSLASALGSHDGRTRGHAERVRAYVDLIAAEMHISEEDRDRLRWAALLHDIGKLEIPAEILNKTEPLTPEEWELLHQHPNLGMRVAAPLIPWLGPWAETIAHHHERYDGRGYPRGLEGERINLGARIVAVADAFDVMTSARSYNRPVGAAAARRELTMEAGRQFDPVVVRALFNVSLGRLRWIVGPISWMAQMPFVTDIGGLARWAGTAVQSAAGAAAVMVALGAGLVSFPLVTEATEHVAPAPPAGIQDTGAQSPPPAAGAPSSPPSDGTTTTEAYPTTTVTTMIADKPAPPTTSSVTTTMLAATTTLVPATTTTTSSNPTTTTTTTSVAPTTTTPGAAFVAYLHNDPTPPTGDTTSPSSVLPMNTSSPLASTLYNYDTDRDDEPGLLLQKTGQGLDETHPNKQQIWSLSLASPLKLEGQVTLTLWSTIKDFDESKGGEVLARLMSCNGSGTGCTTLAEGGLSLAFWNGGAGTWVARAIDLGAVDHNLGVGRTLRVKIVVGGSSDDDLWFAYDTSAYTSRIRVDP